MNIILEIKDILKQHVNEVRRDNPLFFKIGPGEYSEHDKFLGVSVPVVRKVSKQFVHISLEEIYCLLISPYNEERLLALFIIVLQYNKADEFYKNELYHFYMKNIKYVNNWNLVDSSAHYILGAHIEKSNKDILIHLANSKDLWERRIAIIATWNFIKKSDFILTFTIAKILLKDEQDLIHKAVGWMLREVGKQNESQLKFFLDEHVSRMPRTMLRYAIEKLPQIERLHYLKNS